MRPYCRIREGKWISGIALGLAYYWRIDVRLIRIALVALACLTNGGLAVVVLYFVLAFATPQVASSADLPRQE